jgi:GTPase KRas protein
MFTEGYDPTIEDSYTKWVTINNKERVFLQVIDTAGQEAFVAIRDNYIQNGDGFMLVYSLTDERSFQRLEQIR